MPEIPHYATNNAHMFYIVCRSLQERSALIKHLKDNGILSVFHYLSLHKSGYYTENVSCRPEKYQSISTDGELQIVTGLDLPNCDRFADCLLRLPMFFELGDDEIDLIIKMICDFFRF